MIVLKKDVSTNDWGTKIWSFPLHYGSIDVIIKKIQIMWCQKKILTLGKKEKKKRSTLNVKQIHSDYRNK